MISDVGADLGHRKRRLQNGGMGLKLTLVAESLPVHVRKVTLCPCSKIMDDW